MLGFGDLHLEAASSDPIPTSLPPSALMPNQELPQLVASWSESTDGA